MPKMTSDFILATKTDIGKTSKSAMCIELFYKSWTVTSDKTIQTRETDANLLTVEANMMCWSAVYVPRHRLFEVVMSLTSAFRRL